MMNESNLKSNSERTPEERKKLASKAGKASGEARRARKTFKELFEIALSVKDDNGLTEQEKIVLRAIEVAKATGNYKDIEATIGEKPKDAIALESEQITGIKIKFVDKSNRSNREDKDPKIVGDYTPPTNTEE